MKNEKKMNEDHCLRLSNATLISVARSRLKVQRWAIHYLPHSPKRDCSISFTPRIIMKLNTLTIWHLNCPSKRISLEVEKDAAAISAGFGKTFNMWLKKITSTTAILCIRIIAWYRCAAMVCLLICFSLRSYFVWQRDSRGPWPELSGEWLFAVQQCPLSDSSRIAPAWSFREREKKRWSTRSRHQRQGGPATLCFRDCVWLQTCQTQRRMYDDSHFANRNKILFGFFLFHNNYHCKLGLTAVLSCPT